MWTLYKREIRSFLGSFIAYIVMSVFLILTGLFLWFVSGNNVFDLGIASLQVMFDIAPYILIFLVSAVTMKSISDEKRLGTMEILTTKPITDTAIVLSKFFASLTLIVFTLALTLVYAFTINELASPVGNVDLMVIYISLPRAPVCLGIASLQVMFDIAPYILIFLVSAVTMKSISDEKRLGTMEILTTKPITDTAIVLSKFFASLTLIVFTLALTLVYAFTINELASPVGNVDWGSMIGSYFGLVLLASCYTAVGLFSSSITDNQIVALLVSMLISFFFLTVLQLLGDVSWLDQIGRSLSWFGLEFHYDSISRGVIDTRDVVYFLGFSSVFLGLTKLVLESRKW